MVVVVVVALAHRWPVWDTYSVEGVGMGKVIVRLCVYTAVIFFAAVSLPEEGMQLLYEDTGDSAAY